MVRACVSCCSATIVLLAGPMSSEQTVYRLLGTIWPLLLHHEDINRQYVILQHTHYHSLTAIYTTHYHRHIGYSTPSHCLAPVGFPSLPKGLLLHYRQALLSLHCTLLNSL